MLIACKYEEMYIPQVEDFVYITDEAYKSKEILSMVRILYFYFTKLFTIMFIWINSGWNFVET